MKLVNLIKSIYVYVVFIAISFLIGWSLNQHKSLIDSIVTILTLSLSGCLSIAMFNKNGFDISIINTSVATMMAVVFWRNKNIALFLLMLYSIVSSIYMSFIAIKGQRDITNPKFYLTIVTIIFAVSIIIYYFSGKFKTQLSYVLIFEFLSFALTAISQTLLVAQSRWLFLTFALKDIMEIILGIVSINTILITKNIFFFFTNLVSFVIWTIDRKREKN